MLILQIYRNVNLTCEMTSLGMLSDTSYRADNLLCNYLEYSKVAKILIKSHTIIFLR